MYRSTYFLTQVLVGGEWSALYPDRLTPGERALSINWIGGSVSARTGLDDVEKRKFLTLPGLELRSLCRPASKPVAIPTELSRLLLWSTVY
jgi:hypothetical protein